MSSNKPNNNPIKSLGWLFQLPVLMMIGLIVSGIWLAPLIRVGANSRQVLKFEIRNKDGSIMVLVQATGSEVILGFTAVIATFLIGGFSAGPEAYSYFRGQFGIDLGHFPTIIVISYLGTALWSSTLHLVDRMFKKLPGSFRPDRDSLAHKASIDELKDKER